MEENLSENLAELARRHRQTAIIVAVPILFTAISTIIFTILSLFVSPKSENSVAPETLRTLWIVIIFLAVGTFVLRRMFFRWDRLRDIALLKGVKGLLRTLQSNAIILAVLAETVFLVGLVVAFLSGDWFDVLRAGIVALILLAINYPRQSVWEKIVGNLQEL